MTVDLKFSGLLDTSRPTDLTFGALLVAPPEVSLTLAVTMPAPTVSASFYLDNAVYRGPNTTTESQWQVGDASRIPTADTFQQSQRSPSFKLVPHTEADKLRASATPMWDQSVPTPAASRADWASGIDVASCASANFASGIPVEFKSLAPWQAGVAVNLSHASPWQDRLRFPRPQQVHTWQEAAPARIERSAGAGVALPLAFLRETLWDTARRPPPGRNADEVTPPATPPCYVAPIGIDVSLLFKEAFSTDADLLFSCMRSVIPTPTVIVPIRRTYIVINDVQLTRVDGNINLPTYSLTLNIDMDSWTWGFSASLPAASMSDVEPDSFGDPVLLRATVNGSSYLLYAESIQRERVFGKSSITVTGRGQSAALADPYSPILTFTNTESRTAQQLMNDALTTNGVTLGWSVDWRIDDWVVPAGAWSHQGSYMSAANAIAAAAGAFVQPDPVNKILRVRPRYPAYPWEWSGATPDLELPAAVMQREGVQWTEKPAYNGVIVSGTTAGGKLVLVKRAGTPGDVVPAMVTDPLITSVIAGRQRAIPILADTGRGAMYSMSLPVLPETGVVEPGTLIRYVDNGNPTIGVVKGVSVTVSMPSVRQTIEVQTHG